MIEVQRVSNKREMKEFIEFPYILYENDPRWVAPLRISEKETFNKRKNPFFKHADVEFFICRKDNVPAGRIAAIVNHLHNEIHGEKCIFFGFFEAVDDRHVSDALMASVVDVGHDRGMKIIRGPVNYSTNETCGLLIKGFDMDPVVMMPYNPPYYVDMAEGFGLRKSRDLYSYLYSAESEKVDKIVKMGNIVMKRGNYTKKGITKKNIPEMVKDFKEIYDQSWEKNWGFVPMTDDEQQFLAHEMKDVVEPDIAFILYHDGKPIGASLSMADFNQAVKPLKGRLTLPGLIALNKRWKKINTLRTLIMGVVPAYRKRGIELALIGKTIEGGRKLGRIYADCGWILEDNEMMNRELINIGAERYKEYRIYEKTI